MAPVALNIAPGLHAWRRAGISHLLMDEDTVRSICERGEAGSKPSPASQKGVEAVEPTRAYAATPHPAPSPTARPNQARPDQPRPDQPKPDQARSAPAALAHPPAEASRPEPSPLTATTAPELHWPAAWQELWSTQATASPQPLAVWTYALLGDDLRGQASPERRNALRVLIAALGMPKGSHAFWPYALPPDNHHEPELFMDALRRFRPGVVLLFGEQTVDELGPLLAELGSLPEKSLQMTMCGGYRFLRLPNLEALSALPVAHRDRLTAFVRAALS